MRIEPTERGEPISAVDILAMGVRGALNLGELVAHTAHGQDVAGVLGIRLYLLPYVADLHIRRAGVSRELGAPHGLHELPPAVYPPGVGGEEQEDVELRGREVHRGALSDHLATRQVDRQPRKLQALRLSGGPGVDAPAPQGRADAANQLPVGKGLGNVVVGSLQMVIPSTPGSMMSSITRSKGPELEKSSGALPRWATASISIPSSAS